MSQPKVDPRVQRTRKLIMDAFIELSSEKEFKQITVKDITEEAMINRATFYYHFEDIYDLLDKALSEVLFINLNSSKYETKEFTETTFVSIFEAITTFQASLSNRCHRGYEHTIARIIREQLEVIFYNMLVQKNKQEAEATYKTTAVMLSWAIYGASVEWRHSNMEQTPEEFITLAIPFLMKGVAFTAEK